jgi:hypothetical protein
MMTNITNVLSEEITNALQVVCPMFGVDDASKFAVELLVVMGLTERTSPSAAGFTTPPRKTTPVVPTAPSKQRARVVSKKMKDAFLAMPGASEDKLKIVIEKYKEASQHDLEEVGGTFEGYATKHMPTESVAVAAPKRFGKWSPASTKAFSEAMGCAITNDLKKKFQEYVESLSEDKYSVLSIQGHMTQFAEKSTGKDKDKDGDDEDLEEFTFEDETLLIGTSTGKIYRSTTEAGDVLIGVAGQGRFMDVKKI